MPPTPVSQGLRERPTAYMVPARHSIQASKKTHAATRYVAVRIWAAEAITGWFCVCPVFFPGCPLGVRKKSLPSRPPHHLLLGAGTARAIRLSMADSDLRIEQFSGDAIRRCLAALAALLKDVVDGGASVSFIAPLALSDATAYWQKVAAEVDRSERLVLVARRSGAIAGCVHLVPASTPNGLHRAEVQKMLVHTKHRRRGVGAALLGAVEQLAQRLGRTLLVLDTERYSAGEALYATGAWTRAGVIADFAANFDGTRLVDTVVYYKRIARARM